MDDPSGESEKLDVLTKRTGILERLVDAPAHKRDLVDELDQSRSTINRAIDELEDVDLVERGDEGFTATVAGRLALERLAAFRDELDDVVAAETVLDPLPFDSGIETEAVAGSRALLATDPAPYRPLEGFHDDLAEAGRHRALLPALDDPRHVRLLYEHVVTGDRPAELVVAPEVFETLRTEFPRRTAAMAETDGFRVLVGDVPAFALALVESPAGSDAGTGTGTTVYVVVFSESGGVHGTLVNGTGSAVRWAEALYAECRTGAEDRTAELADDGDGAVPAAPADGLPVGLEREGFVRLGVAYFRDEPVADPTTAWRAGLTIPEVHTGYAVDRTVASDAGGDDGDGNADRREMAGSIADDLAAGTDCVVVGPPGSGKSTVCKRVACEWYAADRGPVLYRTGNRGRQFESVADLVAAVDAADGHALVVVEDAVRPDADAVFDAIDSLADREDVTFLLDARENEWQDPPGDPRDVPGLAVVAMPPLDEGDVERIVDHFERTTDASVGASPDRLYEQVRDGTAGDGSAANEVLLLLHRLSTYADPLADEATSLEEAVAAVYEDFAGEDLALDVCVLANALNAAGIEVTAGALYAVAGPDEFDAVDAAIDHLEGRVLFSGGDGPYRTVHESWSVTFLEHLLETEGEGLAAERFGDCVTALLSLADDPARRDRIAAHCDADASPPGIGDDPGEWADDVAEATYTLGREHPKLSRLFGDGDRDSVALPAACSADVADEVPVWLGRAFLSGSYLDRAERAFRRLPLEKPDTLAERLLGLASVARKRGEFDEAASTAEECLERLGPDRPHLRARAERAVGRAKLRQSNFDDAADHLKAALERFEAADDRRRQLETQHSLGILVFRQGDYERAHDLHRRNLETSRELGDRGMEASTYQRLGMTEFARGEYGRSRDYFERSLSVVRELGDRKEEVAVLNNLGMVLSNQGDPDRAIEHQRQALDIAREIGDRDTEATTLGNLGLKAERKGNYDRARERLRKSLRIKRDVGDDEGETIRLNNLGLVAVRSGNLDRAHERFRAALGTARDIDHPRREANARNGLGHVARMAGEYDRARECHEAALELTREIGFRRREADSLNKLGTVARELGEYDDARDRHETALSVATDIDHPRERAKALVGLGEIARNRGEYDRADAHVEDALQVVESAGNRIEIAQVRLAAGRLALDRGDVDEARETAVAVHGEFEAMGATQWAGRARRFLGEVAAAAGDPEAARDHWRSAVETFVDVGAPQDALETLRSLAGTCREVGDADAADRWTRRAREVLDGAPDPVVDRYREWVEAHAGALDAD